MIYGTPGCAANTHTVVAVDLLIGKIDDILGYSDHDAFRTAAKSLLLVALCLLLVDGWFLRVSKSFAKTYFGVHPKQPDSVIWASF